MAPSSTSASGTPSMRSPALIGWPCGQVFASPIAASMRSSSTGDIACSSRSASSWTSSHGMPSDVGEEALDQPVAADDALGVLAARRSVNADRLVVARG